MSKVIRKVIRARKKKNTGKVSKRKKRTQTAKPSPRRVSTRGSSQQAKPAKQKSKKSSSGKSQSKDKKKPGRADHLKRFWFKPGVPPPKGSGRPKRSVGLTAYLRKAISDTVLVTGLDPKHRKVRKTVAQALIDASLEHAAKGRFSYMKEVWDRLEGKVPDHIIQETTKKLIKTETEQIALELLDLVSKTADKYMTEKLADKFLKELSEALMKRYAEPPEKKEKDE